MDRQTEKHQQQKTKNKTKQQPQIASETFHWHQQLIILP